MMSATAAASPLPCGHRLVCSTQALLDRIDAQATAWGWDTQLDPALGQQIPCQIGPQGLAIHAQMPPLRNAARGFSDLLALAVLHDVPRDIRRAWQLALHEALENAIVHGSLEISSDLKSTGDWGHFDFEEAARERDPAYLQRCISVAVALEGGRLCATIQDQGPGFDYAAGASQSIDPLALHGRGIQMMHQLADRVTWDDHGRRVRLELQIA